VQFNLTTRFFIQLIIKFKLTSLFFLVKKSNQKRQGKLFKVVVFKKEFMNAKHFKCSAGFANPRFFTICKIQLFMVFKKNNFQTTQRVINTYYLFLATFTLCL
jgi:hypothetical protein